MLAGGGLAYGTYNLMQQSASTTTVAAATQPVVVAAVDLTLGTALKKEDLTTLNFPEGTAPEGSFSKPDELLERGLIVPIVKNEPILAAKLAPKEAGVRSAAGHPRGHARRVGPGQRSGRRRRLRAAGHAGGRRCHRQPDRATPRR